MITNALRSLWAEPRAADAPARGWRDWVLVGVLMVTALLEGVFREDVAWRPFVTIVAVGLAPVLVSRTIDKIKELKEQYKLTVLMAEQNFPQALRIADRGYVIVHGQIAFEGRSADELNNNELIRKFYLGL